MATKSGYSERLISKAESGQPISTEAIEVLAQTFATKESPVYPEDLITDVLQMAKTFIKTTYQDHSNFFKTINRFLDDDIVFNISGDVSEIPFAGRHCGREGVRRAIEILFSVVQPPENFDEEPHYQFTVNGNDVFITGHTWLHPIGFPTPPIKIAIQMKFRRGKLYYYEDWLDTSAGAKVLQENPPPEDSSPPLAP